MKDRRLPIHPSSYRHALLLAATLVALYPPLFVVLTSLKERRQYLESNFGLPWPLYFGNFHEALHGGQFFLWFANSAVVTAGAVLLCLAIAVLAAFAMAQMRLAGRDLLLTLNVALMVVPPVVMLIPLFQLYTELRWIGTYHG